MKHLIDNFSILPANGDELLNGHVHHVFLFSGTSNRADTVRQLCAHFPTPSTSDCAEINVLILHHVDAGIKRIQEKYKTVKKASDPNEFREFDSHCRERFFLQPIIPADVSVQPIVSADVSLQPIVPAEMPSEDMNDDPRSIARLPPISPIKRTRQVAKCHTCKRLRLDNKNLRVKQVEIQRDHFVTIQNLQAKKKKNTSIR